MYNSKSNYESTVQYLYSLQKHGIKLGLANTEALMHLLNRPHTAFRSIHIAGTNGKVSTATALASMLSANGLKVGLFTSPHLVSFTERIRINNRKIDESDVIDLASNIRTVLAGTDLNPTFFEFVTAMAFQYFAINNVEWAVIETGMGGRLDATNVLSPEVCIITNISHDHMEFLGDTLRDITYEKAGIIKPGVPVITAASQPEVIDQLQKICDERSTALHVYGKDFMASLTRVEPQGTHFDYSGYNKYSTLSVPLAGAYQAANAAMAIRAYELLQKNNLPLSDNALRESLKAVSLEGRLERASDDPPILIDSAHNPEASQALASNMRTLFPDKNIISILGIMDDKDLQEIIRPLAEISRLIILTRAKYDRAASPDKLREVINTIQRTGDKPVEAINTGSVSEAMAIARKALKRNDIILVAGSFYTSGEVKELLGSVGILPTLRESLGTPAN